MIKEKLVLAIIPSRGGSIGLPKKGIKLLNGKPLIAYTIEKAKKSRYIDRIIVLTDCNEIAEVAKEYGAEVLMEPQKAPNNRPDIQFFRYAIKKLGDDENFKPDIIINLRPDTPLKTKEYIDASIEKLIETNADCVKTICKAPIHPHKMWKMEGDKLIPFQKTKLWIKEGPDVARQRLPKIYWQNAAVDVFRRENLFKYDYIFGDGLDIRGIVMTREESIDIDTPLDFYMAEIILNKKEK